MKEALKSRRERNRQRLLELQHDVGLQSSELAFQVGRQTGIDTRRRPRALGRAGV